MRVGLVFEYSTINGGENSICAAVDVLQEQDIQFSALALHAGALTEQLGRRGILVELPTNREGLGRRQQNVQLVEKFKRMVDRDGIEIIHANSLMMSRRLARCAGVVDL